MGILNMSNLSRKCLDLVLQVAYCKPETVPSYNRELVHQILQETKEHCVMINELIKRAYRDDNLKSCLNDKVDITKYCHRDKLTAYNIHVESILRKKRLLLAYHNHQINLFRELKWKGMTWIENPSLSMSEIDFVKKYDGILRKFRQDIGVDVTKCHVPSEEPIIQVLAKVDIGEVYFPSFGILRINKDSVHLLQRDEVESYLQQGTLSHLCLLSMLQKFR